MFGARDRMWRYRAPPQLLTTDQYKICDRKDNCQYGDNCLSAHSQAELEEWQQRGILSSDKIKQLWETQSSTLAGEVKTKLASADRPESILLKEIPNITMYCDKTTIAKVRNKSEELEWEFTINTYKDCLAGVTFLHEDSVANFCITDVSRFSATTENKFLITKSLEEWKNDEFEKHNDKSPQAYKIKVKFRANTYGVFKRKIVFSFNKPHYLYRDLLVSVKQEDITTKSTDLFITESKRWESLNAVVEIVRSRKHYDTVEDKLLSHYTRPTDITKCTNILERHEVTTPTNYKEFSHSLLYIEETEQYHQLSKLSLSGQIRFTNSYTTESATDDTTNYAQHGELFARLPLESNLSEDTVQGRILLQYVNFVLLTTSIQQLPDKVYECSILERGKDYLIINVPHSFVRYGSLEADTTQKCQIQFVINRLPFCEMHFAIDKLKHHWFLFPDVNVTNPIPWAQQQIQWGQNTDSEMKDVSLNLKQKEGFMAITTKTDSILPPVLLIGPFGTGKTLTLAKSVIHLLNKPNTRILICTHSNSAADLYIKDYLHPLICGSANYHPSILRRVVYKHRWTLTLSEVVRQYALIDESTKSFRDPTIEDLKGCKVVVTTLATCFSLIKLKLESGFFTHIMIDEAAQAKELETLIPLVLADRNTKIFMAGDHMQMNPEVCSQLASRYRLQDSLFERLANLYDSTHYCKIMLDANYRSHEELVSYASDLFYKGKLRACGKPPRHTTLHPLTFLAARGESTQHNGTGYINMAEVNETVDFVFELVNDWPMELWGRFQENSLGVVVPYTDQVHILRAALKKRHPYLRNVSVERVNNVQGKEFRVIVINTVRTYHSCYNVAEEEQADYGFLSNPKLLNTAITRAQSLVVIIGDPFSLCSVGKCRYMWIKFLEQCSKHGSLHGVTFNQIQYYMDIMDIQKQYKLNPAAQTFIPKAVHEQIAANYAGQPFVQSKQYPTQQALYPMGPQSSFSFNQGLQMAGYQSRQHYPMSPAAAVLDAPVLSQSMAMAQTSLLQSQFPLLQSGPGSSIKQHVSYNTPSTYRPSAQQTYATVNAQSHTLSGTSTASGTAQVLSSHVSSAQAAYQQQQQVLSRSLTASPLITAAAARDNASLFQSLPDPFADIGPAAGKTAVTASNSAISLPGSSVGTSSESSLASLDFLSDVFADWKKFTS